MYLDIEHLSVFAPYCDAVFTDNKMANYLKKWKAHKLGGCPPKVFSTRDLPAFNAYLDEIEKNISEKMKNELEMLEGVSL